MRVKLKRITAYVLFGGMALVSGMVISLYLGPAQTLPVPDHREVSNIPLVDRPLADLDGRTRYLREWQGKNLLVNFWATWCAPCREEIPLLQSTWDRYRDRGIEVIGVAFDEENPVKAFRDELKIRYELLLAFDDPFSLLSLSGNEVGGLPHSVLLDVNGNVLASHTGILTQVLLEELIRTHFFR